MKTMRILRNLFLIALLAGLAATGLWAYSRAGSSTTSSLGSIPTFTARIMDFEVRLSSIGALEAAASRNITAPYSGKILRLLPEGEYVSQGDPVIWMETTDFEEKLKDDEVELELARSQLGQAEEEYNLLLRKQDLDEAKLAARADYEERRLADSHNQYEISKKLVESSLASVSELETRKLNTLQAQLALEDARIELEKFRKSRQSEVMIALSKIEQRKVSLEKFEREVAERRKDIEDAILRAPGSGHISYLTVRVSGQNVKPSEGAQVYERSALIQIPDSKTMLAKVPISELEITKINVGQRVEVRVQAFPGKSYGGRVIQKSFVPLTDTSFRKMVFGDESSVKEFEVTVELDGEDMNLRQGMTASVHIIVQEPSPRLAIPQVAVFAERDTPVVYRRRDNSYEAVPVKTGLTNDNYVEILEGIAEGDVLFLRDPSSDIKPAETLLDAA